MKVVIIGTGNTASILGRLIREKGHQIAQLCVRNKEELEKLSAFLGCPLEVDLSNLNSGADLYIIAVSDKAIESVAKSIHLKKGILVHTAGSVSKEVLKSSARNYGIIYPLQSLRKEAPQIPAIPILIDANTEDSLTLLQDFASSISRLVIKSNDEDRKKYHLGAVLVNNFPNYLYAKTLDYCNANGIDFSILYPLILHTSERLLTQSPIEAQTGPAVRGDVATINRHLKMLENDPELEEIYRSLSEKIQSYFQKKS